MFAKEACRKSFTVDMNTDWLIVATLADLQGEGDRQVRTFFAAGESRLATPRGRRAARQAKERKKVEEEASAKGTNEVLMGDGGGPSVTPIGPPISTARTLPNHQASRAEERKGRKEHWRRRTGPRCLPCLGYVARVCSHSTFLTSALGQQSTMRGSV